MKHVIALLTVFIISCSTTVSQQPSSFYKEHSAATISEAWLFSPNMLYLTKSATKCFNEIEKGLVEWNIGIKYQVVDNIVGPIPDSSVLIDLGKTQYPTSLAETKFVFYHEFPNKIQSAEVTLTDCNQRAITHELGHAFLGLHHNDDPSDVMNLVTQTEYMDVTDISDK